MPKMVSEISQGMNFDFSMEQGASSMATSRVFRILKTEPSEDVNINDVCEISIGDEHPYVKYTYCYHVSSGYEGDSRMVILATFQYRSTVSAAYQNEGGGGDGGGGGGGGSPPDVRLANWYTNSTLVEAPAYTWTKVSGVDGGTVGGPIAIENPVGDLYEGVTRLVPIVTLVVEQFERQDPTRNNEHAGKTNSKEVKIGSLKMPRRTLMFRGVQSKPASEYWGKELYSGWQCTYEFLFKRNTAFANVGDGVFVEQDVGWDILQPVSGFNCKAFTPNFVQNTKDNYAQPLKWYDQDDEPTHKRGEIVTPLALPDGISPGDKVRAMVKIAVPGGKVGQRPSAQPIPLNADGTPRSPDADPKVLVYRYKVTEEMDFDDLKLRTPVS